MFLINILLKTALSVIFFMIGMIALQLCISSFLLNEMDLRDKKVVCGRLICLFISFCSLSITVLL